MLSFIVPAYNEQLELPATIDAIRAAVGQAEQACEIIVVDDASADSTAQVATNRGVRVVPIKRRQIAASRNAGAQAASGEILFFVDADTRISAVHVVQAIKLLNAGWAGGSARVAVDGTIPAWARIFVGIFSVIYFGLNLGAGAFLFTTRENFNAVGGFDEELFIGEEVYFSKALKKRGRFKVVSKPIVTSGRKLRMYSAYQILSSSLKIILRGPRVARSRDELDLWYNGRREQDTA